MRWLLPSLALCAGCSSLLGFEDFHTVTGQGDASMPADATDAMQDASDLCYGALSPICLGAQPTGSLTLDTPINTGTDSRCQVIAQASGPALCVLASGVIAVNGNVTVTGTRPLVLLAQTSITITGTLDASSKRVGPTGANANATECPAATPAQNNQEAGGGAGGSLGGKGGDGGTSGSGATGATAIVAQVVTSIRGGCPGTPGGTGQAAPGAGGSSGGAIAFVSHGSITISNSGGIYASGAGGGGTSKTGPGGGGSGGLIVLDAPSITNDGTVTANGGGGGGTGDAQTGDPGADGTTTMYNVAAIGGDNKGDSHGGDGGAGGMITAAAANGANAAQGAGSAGGGGVGIIWLHGTLGGGTRMSPAAQTH